MARGLRSAVVRIDVPPSRSGHCARGEHGRCPHHAGVEQVGWWRSRPPSEWKFRVCACDCHVGCPLAGQPTTPRDAWRQRCVCPGAADAREAEQVREERRREIAAVYAEARRTRQRGAEQIERRLREVFQAHGEEPPPGLTTGSRVAAAANAGRGTRTVRLLAMGARGTAGSVRWAWRPPVSDRDADNRAQLRQMHRVIGSAAAIASLLTAAAGLSSGPRRLMWGAGAALSWLTAAAVLAIGTALTQVSRLAEERSRPTPF